MTAEEEDGSAGHETMRHVAAHGSPRWRALALDAAVLVGLSGVAITQPLLELLGENPTFFVAGHYSSGQVITLALVVGLVPSAVLFLATALTGQLHRGIGRLAHGLAVGLLAGLFAVMVCRTIRLDGLIYVWAAAVGLGILVAYAEWRITLVRNFLGYLALGNVGFVALFLVASPAAELLSRSDIGDQAGTAVVPPLDGPVLIVVLDELPVTSLMRADGTINDTRYPNFARLADRSTWFRNAASEAPNTFISVPSILSGRRADRGDLPTLEDHPRNFFTLFGDRYRVNRFETVTDMCPSDVCEPPSARPFRGMLDDALLAYKHRVLPPELRDGLASVESGWGDFAETLDAPVASEDGSSTSRTTTTRGDPMAKIHELTENERAPSSQAAALLRQVSLIDDEPTINFVHVILPHHPYVLTPWGSGEMPTTWMPDRAASDDTRLPDPDDPAYDFSSRQVYPLQAMQLGALDRLIGDAITGLEQRGAWDEALVVITSDHGTDVTPPGIGKLGDGMDTDEVLRVPLFIKAPGQVDGEIRDNPASTVDVLPSIVDLLDIETDWEFEGHSLFDGSHPTIDRRLTSDVEAAMEVAARHGARYPRGEDWIDLAAVGEGEDLVGRKVAQLTIGDQSPLRWRLEHEELLSDVSVTEGPVPYLLRGVVVTDADRRPPELVVEINGTVAGTIGGYRRVGDGWAFTGHMAPFFRDGDNDVTAHEVDRGGGTVVLHPLGEM